MELKKGEIRIYYKTEVGEIDFRLDATIREALAKHGYRQWASGFDLTTDVRDLAFDKY